MKFFFLATNFVPTRLLSKQFNARSSWLNQTVEYYSRVTPKSPSLKISFFIVNCVFNSFIRYTATMLNFATIYVQKRLRSRNLSKVIHFSSWTPALSLDTTFYQTIILNQALKRCKLNEGWSKNCAHKNTPSESCATILDQKCYVVLYIMQPSICAIIWMQTTRWPIPRTPSQRRKKWQGRIQTSR